MHAVLNAAILLLLIPEFIIFSLYLFTKVKTDAGLRMLRFLMLAFPLSTGFVIIYFNELSAVSKIMMLVHSLFVCISAMLMFYETSFHRRTDKFRLQTICSPATARFFVSILFISLWIAA